MRGAGVEEVGIEERLTVLESCLILSQKMSHQEDWGLHLKLLREALWSCLLSSQLNLQVMLDSDTPVPFPALTSQQLRTTSGAFTVLDSLP